VIGQREAESDSLALRVRGAGKKQEVMPVDAFLARVTEEVRTRALAPYSVINVQAS
jgi:threonyl-tRNA synthetase